MGRAKTFGVGREYDYPLNQLLILGRPTGEVTDAAFVDELGLTPDHAPQLIRMATDPALSEAFDFPAIYACRALAKFRHEPAIGPLVTLLRAQHYNLAESGFEDWVWAELPEVFAQIGPAVLEPLTDVLADASVDMWSRQAALDALVKLVERHPSQAPRVVEIMGNELAKFAAEPELNGNLAWELSTLQATKWLPTIRPAFDRGLIDEALVGDWSKFADHHKPDTWPAA